MWLFWITIVFALVYLVSIRGSAACRACSAGRPTGRTRRKPPKFDASDQAAVRQVRWHGPEGRSPPTPQARAMGQRLFLNYCAQCHGSDARRRPRLSEPDRQRLALRRRARDHQRSITNGRNGRDAAAGPGARRRDGVQQRRRLRALALGPAARRPEAQLGKPIFAQNCAACHGPDGQGQPGARRAQPDRPDLALRQLRARPSSKPSPRAAIGRPGGTTPMPSHKDMLGDRPRSSCWPPTSGACRTAHDATK